jgi:membrane protease YdiL (CAAX protease family)
MKTSMSLKRSPLTFFVLVFALSLLFWLLVELLGPLAEHISLGLPIAIPSGFNPVSPLVGGYMPLIAACILVTREGQPGGISRLLKRVFDLKSIRHKIWYVPILFLNPLIYVLSYGAMLLLRLPLPEPHILWLTIPIFFVYFFLEAVGEEVGWTGYVTDPLQERWGALKAGLILGVVTAIWHIIPGLQAHQTLTYITWQGLFDVAGRVLYVWLYSNTGKSVFGAILFHDMYNIGYVLFPNNGSHYDPAIAFPITLVIAVIVTFLWGAQTLARYRYARPQASTEDDSPA